MLNKVRIFDRIQSKDSDSIRFEKVGSCAALVRVHHRHGVPGGQGGDHCLSRVCVAQADFYYSSFVKEVLYLILGT